MKENITALIHQIQQMNELFYQQKNSEGFGRLDPILVSLVQILDGLFKLQLENNSLEQDKIEINNILVKAMNAIEIRDTILIADIFEHELIIRLQAIMKLL